MGYCVSIAIEDVVIPSENYDACEKAVLEALKFNPKMSLIEVFEKMRFEVIEERDSGNLRLRSFWGEKLGYSDELLWETIAPFVRDEGTVTYHGEDGESWAYKFKNGKLIHGTFELTWKE